MYSTAEPLCQYAPSIDFRAHCCFLLQNEPWYGTRPSIYQRRENWLGRRPEPKTNLPGYVCHGWHPLSPPRRVSKRSLFSTQNDQLSLKRAPNGSYAGPGVQLALASYSVPRVDSFSVIFKILFIHVCESVYIWCVCVYASFLVFFWPLSGYFGQEWPIQGHF